jgi:hypothetical protein
VAQAVKPAEPRFISALFFSLGDSSQSATTPIAQLVADSIHYGAQHLQYYELEAFVVMANHVHLLVPPRASPADSYKL